MTLALVAFALYLFAFAAVHLFFAVSAQRDVLTIEPARTPPTPPSKGGGMDAWLWQSYADMSEDHRNPSDADVLEVTHQFRHLDARAEAAAGAENKGDMVTAFRAIVSRCVQAHHYGDNGWRP